MSVTGYPPVSTGLVSGFTLELEDTVAVPREFSLTDVPAARLRCYHQQCDQRLATTMLRFQAHQARSWPRESDLEHWKLLRERRDICVYRHKTRQAQTSTVQAIGTLHGAFDDVMNGLYADSTRTAQILQKLLSPLALNARVLQVEKSQSETKPYQFAGIVSMAVKVRGLLFCRPREFVCFKKMAIVQDEMGDDVGVLVWHSIDELIEEVAVTTYGTSKATRPFVRGFLSLAIVFKRVGDDRVTMFAYGHFNPKGHLMQRKSDQCIAEWLLSMSNAVQSGQAKNLSRLILRPSTKQNNAIHESSKSQGRCGICARALFFWDAPRSCRGCWQLCCRVCRVQRPIFCAHSHASATVLSGPCIETFCLACVGTALPTSALIHARLLQRLAKKRKRTPPGLRSTLATSSTTDGSAMAFIERDSADLSSISALSSRDSEKYQHHRLSLDARAKTRENKPRLPLDECVEMPILEVLAHYQHQRRDSASEGSSNASLRSYTSADLAPTSTLPLQLGRYPSGHSLLAHNPSFYHSRVRLPESGNQMGVPRGLSCLPTPSSFWLPRESTLVKKSVEALPMLGDEYYQRLLQSYLLHMSSSHSLASVLSMSSHNGQSQAAFKLPMSLSLQ
ncbi:hypothetical protein CCR75_001642 [Bremia lactucae]|uniref:FYVE-type domain-containing protein n=1 Tax=Bremia lactucae TaxID=4779 RepID=A0A976FNP4_BRELC|nr:hypothetical protein CCR75_001642 [Bremia lactucae]